MAHLWNSRCPSVLVLSRPEDPSPTGARSARRSPSPPLSAVRPPPRPVRSPCVSRTNTPLGLLAASDRGGTGSPAHKLAVYPIAQSPAVIPPSLPFPGDLFGSPSFALRCRVGSCKWAAGSEDSGFWHSRRSCVRSAPHGGESLLLREVRNVPAYAHLPAALAATRSLPVDVGYDLRRQAQALGREFVRSSGSDTMRVWCDDALTRTDLFRLGERFSSATTGRHSFHACLRMNRGAIDPSRLRTWILVSLSLSLKAQYTRWPGISAIGRQVVGKKNQCSTGADAAVSRTRLPTAGCDLPPTLNLNKYGTGKL